MSTISGFSGEIASTPDGRNWVIKALHPSDPTAVCRGLPDPDSCPNVVMAYYNVFRVSAPAGYANPWGFDLTVMPNLLVPGFYRTVDSTDTMLAMGNFFNTSFMSPGQVSPIYSSLLANFAATGVEAHRLISMGVTAYQDGPALANQGTLTAAQWQVARTKYYIGDTIHGGANGNLAYTRFAKYQTSDEASYATSQHMPNAYFGESKDGCYLPLRLGSTSNHWVTDADLEMVGDQLYEEQHRTLLVPDASGVGHPPFPALIRGYLDASGLLKGDAVYAPLNPIWGGISARNLSPQTSFAFYVRMTVECRVHPASVLAPQQQMSPAYDPVALASYFRINRELKDAYPADYNDWGKLWEVIKGAARVALPALSAIPGPVGLIASAAHAGVNAIDSMTRKSAPRDTPPAAQVQRAQDAVAAQRVASVRKRVAKRKRRQTR